MEQKIYKHLRELPQLKKLSDEKIKTLVKYARIKTFKKDEFIYYEGDEAYGFYVVISGLIKLFRSGFSTRLLTLGIKDSGTLIGLSTLVGVNTYPSSAQALVDTEVIFYYYSDFLSIIKRHPEISMIAFETLCNSVCELIETTTSISLKKVPIRLAEYLLSETGPDGNDYFRLQIKKGELASLLGTVPETLSRAFKYLKKLELIDLNDDLIKINDKNALKVFSQGKYDEQNYIFM
jgi:CRP/FNR family transcriptional regulator